MLVLNQLQLRLTWIPGVTGNARNRGIQNARKWLKNPNCVQANKGRDLLIALQEDCTTEIAGKELAQEENKSKAKQNLYTEEKKKRN